MHKPIIIEVTKVRCVEETDGMGSDEPYILVFAARLNGGPIPSALTTKYGPWDDVDTGELLTTVPVPSSLKVVDPALWEDLPLVWRQPCWGIDRQPGLITDPDDVVVLVAMMEHDDGSPKSVRAVLHSTLFASLISYVNEGIDRSALVSQLRKDMDGALGGPLTAGWPDWDDQIGYPKELRLTSEDLEKADNGVRVKNLTIKGDGATYRIRFELRAPFLIPGGGG